MSLPHIQNSEAGRNYYDPFWSSIFEGFFSLPDALQASFGKDLELLSEHILNVKGLGTLDASPELAEQSFKGTKRSYLKPHLSDTRHTITIDMSLNMRNEIDNYVYKVFRAWNKLGYDLETGAINLKKDYIAPFFRLAIANRKGDIVREVVFKDVILTKVEGISDFDYTSDDPVQITITLNSDWATDAVA